jgi:hypothetical protein
LSGPGRRRLEEIRKEREKRLLELKQRENKKSLSKAETAELAQAQVLARYRERLAQLEKQADADRDQRRETNWQQVKADFGGKPPADDGTLAEFRKFAERTAKLERAREVAVVQARDDLAGHSMLCVFMRTCDSRSS